MIFLLGDKVFRKERWKGGKGSRFRWLENLNDVRRCSATDYLRNECGGHPLSKHKCEKCTQPKFVDQKQKNQTTENSKQQTDLAGECNSVESQLHEKILLTESQDIDHRCTTREKSKKEDQYQPTTLWRFIKVLTDYSQSDSIEVTFQQCKKNSSCSKQRVKGQCNRSSTVLESETELTIPFKPVGEMSNACRKQKQASSALQLAKPSNSAGEMLFIKVIVFLYGYFSLSLSSSSS